MREREREKQEKNRVQKQRDWLCLIVYKFGREKKRCCVVFVKYIMLKLYGER